MQMRHSRMGQSPAAGGQKANMGSIRRLLHYMAPYRKGFIFVIIGAMLGTLFGVLTLATIKAIVTAARLNAPWWQSITTGAMLCFFILLQSVVLSMRGKRKTTRATTK